MKISMNEVSRLLGISPEAIRKYERKGILALPRNAENGYREFDPFDVGALVCARQLRQCGFSLEDIASILHSDDKASFLQRMETQKELLAQEIQRKQQMLDALTQWQKEIEACKRPLQYALLPALYFLPYMSVDGLEDNRDGLQYASEWMNQYPTSWTGVVYFKEGFVDQPVRTSRFSSMRTGVFLRAAQPLPEALRKLVTYYPQQLCATFSFAIEKQQWLADELPGILAQLEANGYACCGDIISKHIRVEHYGDPDRRVMEYQYWIPVNASCAGEAPVTTES